MVKKYFIERNDGTGSNSNIILTHLYNDYDEGTGGPIYNSYFFKKAHSPKKLRRPPMPPPKPPQVLSRERVEYCGYLWPLSRQDYLNIIALVGNNKISSRICQMMYRMRLPEEEDANCADETSKWDIYHFERLVYRKLTEKYPSIPAYLGGSLDYWGHLKFSIGTVLIRVDIDNMTDEDVQRRIIQVFKIRLETLSKKMIRIRKKMEPMQEYLGQYQHNLIKESITRPPEKISKRKLLNVHLDKKKKKKKQRKQSEKEEKKSLSDQVDELLEDEKEEEEKTKDSWQKVIL